MADLLRIGASGITTYQNALTVTGNNITKANLEGYSRQEAIQSPQLAQKVGVGYIGSGVSSDGVRRIADEFLTRQLRVDTTAFNNLDGYLSNIEQLDILLADAATGLTGGIDKFFKAVEGGAQDPASIPSRQAVLSEAEGLVGRYHMLSGRLSDHNATINTQLVSIAEQITALSKGIASLNNAIAQGGGTNLGNQPNDLLDQRDAKLKELSELVSVTVVNQDGGMVNVFIGNGQALVLGTQANELEAQEGVIDPFRFDLGFVRGTLFQSVSQDLTGGKLGGLLEFRQNVLDRSFNELGRIALAMADNFNTQQSLGLDLEGNAGNNFFTDINSRLAMEQRSTGHIENLLPDDRVVTVSIEDVGQLTTSDYLLEFITNTNFTITRISDNAEVFQGLSTGAFPLSIDLEGMSINLESGSFQQGDLYLIQPTRHAAADLDLEITRTQELAFAYPISTDASLGNVGAGVISQGEMLDVFRADGSTPLDSFSVPGQLSPPIIIRFSSATSYDVLDNTDPANPVDLQPPMRGRTYSPGIVNEVFGRDPNQTSVSTDTVFMRTATAGLTNGTPAETVSIVQTSPGATTTTNSTVTIPANTSARNAAVLLSQVEGVSAFADTSVVLSINDAGAAATPMNITLRYGAGATDFVTLTTGTPAIPDPNPLTVDFLRDAINDNQTLINLGIVAVSNPVDPRYAGVASLSVRATHGEDLTFSVTAGDAGDQLNIRDINRDFELNALAPVGATVIGVGATSTVGGVIYADMDDNGYLSTNLAAPGGRFSNPPPTVQATYTGYQVSLTGTPAASDEFTIDYNVGGVSDNRNALVMASFATSDTIQNNGLSYQEAYGQLVEYIGTETAQTRINQEAAESLMRQSQANRDSLSGVSLDEEAAQLIRFEQAYNASAQVVNIARQLFDQLMAVF